MKISVITVLNTNNYGSVLQTLATQKFFEELGLEVEFVDYIRKDQGILNSIISKIMAPRTTIIKWIKKPANDIFDIAGILKAPFIFRSFLKKNINLSKYRYHSNEELKKRIPSADIYCTGSDQMWNSYS